MKTAVAKETSASISFKSSLIICREIKGKKVEKVKKILKDILNKKRSLNGKYYTNAVKKFLDILKTAEANAKEKNLAVDRLFVRNAIANKGETKYRPKTRWRLRGRKQKSTNIEIVVEER